MTTDKAEPALTGTATVGVDTEKENNTNKNIDENARSNTLASTVVDKFIIFLESLFV